MTDTTVIIVAADSSAAQRRAKREGFRRWTGITPSNYRALIGDLAVPREQVIWDDVTWAFPPAMVDAISQCTRRAIT
jgi:AraC-like DNA-binding protein